MVHNPDVVNIMHVSDHAEALQKVATNVVEAKFVALSVQFRRQDLSTAIPSRSQVNGILEKGVAGTVNYNKWRRLVKKAHWRME